jgi:hypothetical protein
MPLPFDERLDELLRRGFLPPNVRTPPRFSNTRRPVIAWHYSMRCGLAGAEIVHQWTGAGRATVSAQRWRGADGMRVPNCRQRMNNCPCSPNGFRRRLTSCPCSTDAFVPIPGAAPALCALRYVAGARAARVPSVTRSRLPAGGSQAPDEVLDGGLDMVTGRTLWVTLFAGRDTRHRQRCRVPLPSTMKAVPFPTMETTASAGDRAGGRRKVFAATRCVPVAHQYRPRAGGVEAPRVA